MWNLAEFRKKPDRLSDFLPWCHFVAPGVMQNKDGAFQSSFAFRGPDLESVTETELVNVVFRLNNVFKRLGSGWGIYVEAARKRSREYPRSEFDNPLAYLFDEERRLFFESQDVQFESNYYLTLVFLPPEEAAGKLLKAMYEGGAEKQSVSDDYRGYLKFFQNQTEIIRQALAEVLPFTVSLTDSETLSYLHSTISPRKHRVIVPEVPMYLDAYIADTPLIGGLEPGLGIVNDNGVLRPEYSLRIISVLSYPGSSVPGIFDSLNRRGIEYRWVTRFLPLDKLDAEKELKKYKQQWFSKRKGIKDVVMEMIFKSESAMSNSDAVLKSQNADAALVLLADDQIAFGYMSTTVVLMDKDVAALEKNTKEVIKIINGRGFTAMVEKVNAVDAWFGSLPGLCRANIRRPLLHTVNLAHMIPVSAVWAGPVNNKHLKGPCLLQGLTDGSTPFRVSTHVGDVGHAMVIGPTGAGKSTNLATMALQFLRYPDAQVYFFDKGGSIRVATYGVGGDYYDLGKEGSSGALSFQPLADIDNENERQWAFQYTLNLLRGSSLPITNDVRKSTWTALCSLANSPRKQRTISGLYNMVQDKEIRGALRQFTIDGPFGKILDSDNDGLSYGRWQAFEMQHIMEMPDVVPAVLFYLFHALMKRFTGKPTMLILDEAWLLLDNPMFAEQIRDWLKVLRKLNVSVVFATQSLSDVAESTIVSALIENCPTMILLPNPKAKEERMFQIYTRFGLNSREIERLAMATPKREYYYKSPLGSRLFELGLGQLALSYTAVASPEDQLAAMKIMREVGKERFNQEWLRLRGALDAAEAYDILMEGE